MKMWKPLGNPQAQWKIIQKFLIFHWVNSLVRYLPESSVILPPRRECRQKVHHVTNCLKLFRVCLGIVQGLFKVHFGFHLGFLVFFFNHGFNNKILSRRTQGFMLDLGFGVLDLGFRVSCFGTQSRHPSGEMDDIPNLIKHWPCAVKTHFPGRTPVLGVLLYIGMNLG